MGETLTIDLAVDGLATAQQLRPQLAAQLQARQAARDALVAAQALELADADRWIGLLETRLLEIDQFIVYKQAKGV